MIENGASARECASRPGSGRRGIDRMLRLATGGVELTGVGLAGEGQAHASFSTRGESRDESGEGRWFGRLRSALPGARVRLTLA